MFLHGRRLAVCFVSAQRNSFDPFVNFSVTEYPLAGSTTHTCRRPYLETMLSSTATRVDLNHSFILKKSIATCHLVLAAKCAFDILAGSQMWGQDPIGGFFHSGLEIFYRLLYCPPPCSNTMTRSESQMAKSKREKIKLESTAGTGVFYTTTKNRRTATGKLEMMKYDKKAQKHVLFKETKLK